MLIPGRPAGHDFGEPTVSEWFPALADAVIREITEADQPTSQLVPGHHLDLETVHAVLLHALEVLGKAPRSTTQENWDLVRGNADRLGVPLWIEPAHLAGIDPELAALPAELLAHIASTLDLSVADLNAIARTSTDLRRVAVRELSVRVPLIHTQAELDALLADPQRTDPAFCPAPGADLSVNRPAAAGTSIHLYGPGPLTAIHFGHVTTHGNAAVELVTGGCVYARNRSFIGTITGGEADFHDDVAVDVVTGTCRVTASERVKINKCSGGRLRMFGDTTLEMVADHGVVHARQDAEITHVGGGDVLGLHRAVIHDVAGGSVTLVTAQRFSTFAAATSTHAIILSSSTSSAELSTHRMTPRCTTSLVARSGPTTGPTFAPRAARSAQSAVR